MGAALASVYLRQGVVRRRGGLRATVLVAGRSVVRVYIA